MFHLKCVFVALLNFPKCTNYALTEIVIFISIFFYCSAKMAINVISNVFTDKRFYEEIQFKCKFVGIVDDLNK